jgi:hypothetical protein
MKQIIAYVSAAALLLGCGVVHGYLTLRWVAPTQAREAAARVPEIPLKLGDWEGTDLEVSKQQMDQTEAYGYISRRYVNRATEDVITMMLLCGRTGPLSVHSPTVCLQGTGLQVRGEQKRYSLVGDSSRQQGGLWSADFDGERQGERFSQRVFWGWSKDASTWAAPEHPRLAFAGAPYLYKLYITRALPPVSSATGVDNLLDDDPCVKFLQVFLPEAKKTFRPSSQPGRVTDEQARRN